MGYYTVDTELLPLKSLMKTHVVILLLFLVGGTILLALQVLLNASHEYDIPLEPRFVSNIKGELSNEYIINGELSDESDIKVEISDESGIKGKPYDESGIKGELLNEYIIKGEPSDEFDIKGKLSIKSDGVHTNQCTMAGLLSGDWIGEKWVPRECSYTQITSNPKEIERCISKTKFGFYGDSTLIAVAKVAMRLGSGFEPNVRTWSPPPFLCGEASFPNSGYAKMWWTPSAYNQKPANLASIKTDDVAVLSMGPWDMGTYYKGENMWHSAMKNIIMQAAKKTKGPLYVMHLHRLYPDKCKQVHDDPKGLTAYQRCVECNSLGQNKLFRAALAGAVTCAIEQGHDIKLIDSFPITDTPFAHNVSDGVHFGSPVTAMELELLLQVSCNGMDTVGLTQCPKIPSYNVGATKKCIAG